MSIRQVALRIHRWLGLTLGLILAVIALSGSILVGMTDIERWVGLDEQPGSGRVPYVACEQSVLRRFPGAVCDNFFPSDGDGRPDRIEVVVRSETGKDSFTVYCDPATGKVIGTTHGSILMAVLHVVAGLHERLLLPESAGRVVLGGMAVALFLFAATGIWLWLTMKKESRTLNKKSFAVHRICAAFTLPVLIFSSFTGLLFAWQWARPIAYRALGGNPMSLPYFAMNDDQRHALRGHGTGVPMSIDALVAAARALPETVGCERVLRITSLGSTAGKPVKIAFDYQGNDDRRSGGVVVQVDRVTGRPVFVDDPRDRLFANWLISRQWAFHAGHWGSSATLHGVIARWFWILSGFGIATLWLSGLGVWRRHQRLD